MALVNNLHVVSACLRMFLKFKRSYSICVTVRHPFQLFYLMLTQARLSV